MEESPEPPLRAFKIGLTLPRAVLYDRIARRAAAMLEEGWVEEVKTLLESGLSGTEPAFQAIGYRQLVDHLKNCKPLSEALEAIVVATRQYAKRQETWFRREPDVRWYEAENPRLLAREVENSLPQRLSPEIQE
jgi:tRNA dimethylallyltransferase